MIAEIIGVGEGERLAEGEFNARMISSELDIVGIELHYRSVLGTNKMHLQQTMAQALNRSDVIIITGGMGMEAEDLTRDIICKGLSLPLVLHKPSAERIRDFFENSGQQMPQAALKMAMLPQNGAVFPNDLCAAPGCAMAAGEQCVILLPGDVDEATAMLHSYVLPFLANFRGVTTVSRTARIFGVTMQQAEPMLNDVFRTQNPVVTLYQLESEILVRVSARANTKAQAANMCTPVLKEIVNRFGDYVYGIDVHSVEEVVLTQLLQKNLRMAAAESCTGGLLASRVSALPDSEQAFCLSVAAQGNKAKVQTLNVPERLIKKYGAISDRVAVMMAVGVMDAGHSDIGVAITGCCERDSTNPAPVGLIYIAVCNKNDVIVKKLSLGSQEPGEIRRLAVGHALNLVRLMLDYAPERYYGAISLGAAIKGKIELCDQLTEEPDMGKPQTGSFDLPGIKALGQESATEAFQPKKRHWYNIFIPAKGDTGGEKARKLILLLFIGVFVGSSIYIGMYFYESFSSKSLYTSLSELISSPQGDETLPAEPVEGYPGDYQPRFATVWNKNKDFKAWLSIPDTGIDYPVVQAADNDYYLRRDFERKDNQHGVLFLDYEVDTKRPSENTIIYGHNMKDGQMFGELMGYKDVEYVREHPTIRYDTLYQNGIYKVAAVFLASTQLDHGPIFEYEKFVNAGSEADMQDFINQIQLRSMVDTGVDLKPTDKLLMLSTCSYEYLEARFVVVGRLLREGEGAEVDTSKIVKAVEPLMPDVYYSVAKAEKPAKFEGMGAWAPKGGGSGIPSSGSSTAPAGPVGPAAPGSNKPSSSSSEESSGESSVDTSTSGSSAPAATSTPTPKPTTAPAATPAPTKAPEATPKPTINATPDPTKAPAATKKPASSEEPDDVIQIPGDDEEPESTPKPTPKPTKAPPKASSDDYWADTDEFGNVKPTRTPVPNSSGSDFWDEDFKLAGKGKLIKKNPTAWAPNESFWEDSPKPSANPGRPTVTIRPGNTSGNTGSTGGSSSGNVSSGKTITVYANGSKLSASMKEILYRMVMAELGGATESEALKAQAVAAYSYLQYNLSAGLTPSIATTTLSKVHSRVKSAVNAVYGEYLAVGGKVINATYFASSAGVTNNSEDVWGGKLSYLRSVSSPEKVPVKEVRLKSSYIEDRVEATLGVDTDDFSPEDCFTRINYCGNGEYVDSIYICGEKKSGQWVRSTLLQNKIPSHAFTVEYDSSDDEFIFTCKGYGHGVGMSQIGAQQMARDGYSYKQILKHYYTGSTIK